MPDPITATLPVPSEGGHVPPSTDVIPKAQYTADLDAKAAEVQALQRTLEEAQATLTSSDYLKYLADKKATSRPSAPAGSPASEKELRDRLASLEVVASQLAATLELQEAERKYPDFRDFRSDVQTILNSNGNLSFEQAYLVAKGRKSGLATPTTQTTPPSDKQIPGTEKPGKFVPESGMSTTEFKSSADASADAARQIREKYGISDIL